jgi:pimeloyl-ACP methyl ester carboxylesterase
MFQRIHFPDDVDVHFLRWEKPLKNESLDHYTDRLLEKFDLSKPIVLFGLSFGGVVMQEIAKKINPECTIIISSLSGSREMPWYFKLIGALRLHRILPLRLVKSMRSFARKLFGATTNETKKLLEQYSKQADIDLLKWSINQILSWRSEKPPAKFFHIHGSNDHLLPLKNKNVNAIIKGGGHFMVYEQAKEVEVILNEQLRLIINAAL